MKRLLLVLWCLSSTVVAQDFVQRADQGERMMATEAGDAYLDVIAPALQAATKTCLESDASLKAGETITLVAEVDQAGALSAVDVRPDLAAADCLASQLLAQKLPPPARWDWQRGDFPLTLSLGKARGTIDGLRYGD